jgi:hypothetical protein
MVLREPSGSVDTDAEIVVSERPVELGGGVSVVAEIAVNDSPSGPVEIDADIVVSELPEEPGGNVSVVAETVVNEPLGLVEIDADTVVSESPEVVGENVSVVGEMVVNEPLCSVETDAEIVLKDGPGDLDRIVPVLPGSSVIVKPSVVIVVGEETPGSESVSEPITIAEVGSIVYVEPLIVTTSGKVVTRPDVAIFVVD